MAGWLSHTSGVGDRNGTTAHTIGHSSAATPPSSGCALNFSPTAGRELLIITAGSTISTSSGAGAGSGWTKRQQPVNAAELAVFTKTAVGNDFLTLSHGTDSNYPIAWWAIELPGGSTYTNSVGSTANNDTFTALGSLPGTAQLVIAAYCGAVVGAVTGTGSTVSAPWVEDVDSITADAATDGIYLYVFYQEGVTATSITPSLTPGITGGIPANRQKITVAYTVAAAATPVAAALSGTGTLSATAVKVGIASASLSGTGTLSATATVTAVEVIDIAAVFTAAGTLHATVHPPSKLTPYLDAVFTIKPESTVATVKPEDTIAIVKPETSTVTVAPDNSAGSV